MKNTALSISVVLAVMLLVSGCASSGAFLAGNVTNVDLGRPNYEIVATNVVGEASAGYLFGVSGSFITQMQTVAIARIEGSGRLYEEALNNLWENFEADYDGAQGRDLALVNVTYDTEALNLLVYTRPTVVVRADVVEFVEE